VNGENHEGALRGEGSGVPAVADSPVAALIAYAESLARIAAGGGGAKALAAHLAAHASVAVLVEDADWKHLALAGSTTRGVPPSTRELYESAAEIPSDGAPLGAPAERGSRVFAIRAGESRLGRLGIFGSAEAVAANEDAIRITATYIAVEMSRDAGGSRGRRRSFWDRLLARAYDDAAEARDDAAARGIALASGYVAVALEAEGLDESVAAQKNAEIRKVCVDALSTRVGELVVIERGGGFLFLCPAALEIDIANARTAAGLIPKHLAKVHIDAKVVGGIGTPAEMLDVATSVDRAREALVIARRMFGGGRVMAYEGLGVYPLLLRGGGTREELRAFAQRVLEPLRAYDDKHQTELVRTIRLFFDVGQNIKLAASSLNVHRHTVFYRLRQISEIGGLDLDSPHDQLTLRAAIAADALGV
jgi:DNA-binding PucR family transcriptional regulator